MTSARRSAGRRRAALIYGGTIALSLFLLQLVLRLGHGLHGPRAAAAAGTGAASAPTSDLVWRLLLASAVIITVARLVGALFVKINQPQVVGEIVAGLVLGPSAARSAAPLLIVRRHGQRGRLRRQREWIVATAGEQESQLAERPTSS